MTGTRVEAGQEGGVGRGQGAGREVGAGGETPGHVPGAGGQLLPLTVTIQHQFVSDLVQEGGPGLVQEGEGVEAGYKPILF